MKIKKNFIPVAIAVGLIVGFLAIGLLKTAINNPPIVQARSKGGCSSDKITDRRAFMEGVFLVQDVRNRGLRSRRDKLAGLDGVQVLVENLPPNAERHGITRQLLRMDTELRLRMHGVKVGTHFQPQDEKLGNQDDASTPSLFQSWEQAINAESDEDFLEFAREKVRYDLFRTYSPPTLYINVTTVVSEEGWRAGFAHRVELQEAAYLHRNGAWCSAPAWYTGGVGVCSLRDLKEYVREALRDDVDEFINAYLVANPKDRSSEEAQ